MTEYEAKQLKLLAEKFDTFLDQYDKDMRGETDTEGKPGLVNDLREVKRQLKEYPSFLWLLSHKTGRTLSTVFVVLTIFQVLWYIGLVNAVGDVLGVDLSTITEALKTIQP